MIGMVPKEEKMEGKQPGEICIPLEKLMINDGEEQVEPSEGDIVNPDMKVTRVQDKLVYMVPVDGMQEEKQPTLEDEESELRKMAEESDKMAGE